MFVYPGFGGKFVPLTSECLVGVFVRLRWYVP